MCVKEKGGREVFSGGRNRLSVHEIDIPTNKQQQIFFKVMVYTAKRIILQNDLVSFALLNIFFPTLTTVLDILSV